MLIAKEAQVIDMENTKPSWRKWAGRGLLVLLFILNMITFGPLIAVVIVLNIIIILFALTLISEEVF